MGRSKYENNNWDWCGERLDLRGDLWMGQNRIRKELTENMHEAMMNAVSCTSVLYDIKRVGNREQFYRKKFKWETRGYWWMPKFNSILRKHGYEE